MKVREYKVRGLLKRGCVAKQFSVIVSTSSAKLAEKKVRDLVHNYCVSNYSDFSEVKCIINKKTERV